ncbi:MAG: flagellar export chaperone FliS [Candidatus Azotimanducaceae bacterium]
MNLSSAAYLFAMDSAVNVADSEDADFSMAKRAKGLSSYGQVREQAVASTTSATELMTMLFDKACVLLKTAIRALESDDDQAFHQSALHALQIVLSLRFVLDTDSGSELSESLFATYTTIAASLKKAKEEQDINSIETIYEALDELRTAWHSLA